MSKDLQKTLWPVVLMANGSWDCDGQLTDTQIQAVNQLITKFNEWNRNTTV